MITWDIGPSKDSGFGLSTDTKPTQRPNPASGKMENIRNGSTLYLMDNKKLWMFDQEHLVWLLQ